MDENIYSSMRSVAYMYFFTQTVIVYNFDVRLFWEHSFLDGYEY